MRVRDGNVCYTSPVITGRGPRAVMRNGDHGFLPVCDSGHGNKVLCDKRRTSGTPETASAPRYGVLLGRKGSADLQVIKQTDH